MVGIRGLIEKRSIHAVVEYLNISRNEWASAVARTVVASVESLAFIHRVRLSRSIRAESLIPMTLFQHLVVLRAEVSVKSGSFPHPG